jgi:hypothetical protein
MLGESKRGTHSQSTVPSGATSAPVWQLERKPYCAIGVNGDRAAALRRGAGSFSAARAARASVFVGAVMLRSFGHSRTTRHHAFCVITGAATSSPRAQFRRTNDELQPHSPELPGAEQGRLERAAVLEDRRSLLELARHDLQNAVEPLLIRQVIAFMERMLA